MNRALSNIGSAWMLVTSVVSGVDTYQGMNCASRAGGYIQLVPDGNAEDRRPVHALVAVPYGIVRGILYNAGQALGTEGACGANSYTMRFADGIGRMFNTNAVRNVYLLNQGFLGAPGAMIGGVAAEEFHVFGKAPVRVSRLHPS